MNFRGRLVLAAAGVLVLVTAASGAASPIGAGTYTQDFNTLASVGTANTALPADWALHESGTSTRVNGAYAASQGSDNSGDVYSFGVAGSSERAFGTLLSGTLTPIIGASFTNDTDHAIDSVDIAYTGEQWRLGTPDRGPDRLDFQYNLAATGLTTAMGWVDVDALDFSSPVTIGLVGARDGSAAANRTQLAATISGLSLAPGQTFWVRWTDFNVSGADDGLAVDDFSLTAGEGDSAPQVVSTTPANGATGVAPDANITINFSEPVTTAAGWYSISCGTSGSHAATQIGGPQTYTLNPDADFAFSETCTVTVSASQVSDQDTIDPPDTMASSHSFSFTTQSPPVEIHEIQGAAHRSPLEGRAVVGVEGIVTARRAPQPATFSQTRGFWMQDASPDTNADTSDGIFVFVGSSNSSTPVAQVGDLVRVSGNVSEFRPNPATNLTITQISSSNANVQIVSSGNGLPAPMVIGIGGRMPPTETIDDDTNGSVETGPTTFDPANDGIDFWESNEGMLLQVNNGAVVNETESFGEITLLPDNGIWATGLRTPRGGILARSDYGDFNPERFIVDDEILRDLAGATRPSKAMPDMNVGAQIVGSVVGPLDYSFANFKIQATATPAFFSDDLQPETTQASVDQEITFATFNVENLSVTPASNVTPAANEAKFDRLAAMIVSNLRSPDLIGIEEVQDDSGPTNNGVVDATQTWTKLVSEIQQAGGPLYEFTQINPVNNEDGGAPGGNIRVGFLYRTDRGLSFVSRPGGDSTTATQVVATPSGPQLSLSPGRVDPQNDAWFETRKPLAGEFRARGKKLFVVVNHLSSKTDDQPLMGRFQPPTRFSESPDENGLGGRHAQAAVLNDFVNDILALDPQANVIVLGDINDFEFSRTVEILEGGGELFSAIKSLSPTERYSYVFEGNSQVLDQILLSRNLNQNFPYTYDVVHVNSEFAGQASDHEPSLVRIRLTGRPTSKP